MVVGYDSAAQVANFARGVAVAVARGLDEVAQQQVVACMVTECSGWNYANPLYPWTLPVSDGYPPTVLAPSTKESCGVCQQRPHVPVWWGPQGLSVHDQALYFMVVEQAVGLFLDRLTGTVRTGEPWRQIQEVQGSEFDGVTIDQATGRPYPYAGNYQGNWARAGSILAALPASGVSLTEWITEMAVVDQGALDRFDSQLADSVKCLLEDDEILGNLARRITQELLNSPYPYSDAFWAKLAKAVTDQPLTSQIDKKPYGLADFITYTDRTTQATEAKIDALAVAVKALTDRLGPPVPKPL